jgi:SsrA-binding protein
VALIEHKKARLNYEILEEFEAGLELLGGEVKSLRSGNGKLEGVSCCRQKRRGIFGGGPYPRLSAEQHG